ncbi:cobalamin-independent methionine synthase II family protein [Mucilaginibacter flavus]|uniref:cobalamin-independent methionine synthase II family protein n=1 Tax=Mucilaginibacter flavus TaxID=931504 RepID=UPI0025B379EA|nr:cobalamin-independent methionine synthase II family protein [Mucilaginibacter flavus]MDN3580107.1 cobalamin-independent methionine synthase II family protein [Mucilaginibacter flavus]
MSILTEPIGSIPRPVYLQQAMTAFAGGQIQQAELSTLFDKATQETIKELEATGSPVISDGEQSKPSFVTYPMQGFKHFAADGVVIPFADGHTRQLPKLTGGPFHYTTFANSYLQKARQYSSLPIKQAVISCSAMSLLYPQEGIDGYSRDQFLSDLVNDAVYDIRSCLDSSAYNVQIDFTEARLAIKLDPSKQLLAAFIDLNNQVLDHFTAEEQKKIGVHTCPGGDHDSTHSADIPYAELLPLLFKLHAGNFYMEYAAEKDKPSVLEAIKESLGSNQRIFLGVTDVLNPQVETAGQISDLILEAAEIIPISQLGTTDDCGFSPFGDDISTAREIAFAKIRARVEGTKLAEQILSK